MKNIIVLAFVLGLFNSAFGQTTTNPSYGPVPYRELKETIGDTYILLPRDKNSIKNGYFGIRKATESKYSHLQSEFQGKKLKLISIDDDNNGHFTDSTGTEYIAVLQKRSYWGITPLSDIENAKKVLIGKTLWTNGKGIVTGDYKGFGNEGYIEMNRFDPIIVTDVVAGTSNTFPEVLLVKTAKGESGYITASVSGTNTDLNPEYFFERDLLLENPKVKYHFTPAVWKMVIGRYTDIGMPLEAFILVEGTPSRMYTTKTAKGTSLQLVYGNENPRYFYFEGGKLTATQH